MRWTCRGALSVTFLQSWTFSLAYEYWVSPINAFPSASHIELRFGYSDQPQGPGCDLDQSLFQYLVELTNKTANANPNDGESHYFELGMVPKYVFAGYAIELPTYINVSRQQLLQYHAAQFHSGHLWHGVRVTAPLVH